MAGKLNLRRLLLEALLGFVLWTLLLSPYMLLVIGMTPPQYSAWLLMQAVIVPPVSVVVVRATNTVTRRCKLE